MTMPTYTYLCNECCDVTETFHTIGTAPRTTRCSCGGLARLRIGHGVHVAPSALEHKGGKVREVNDRETNWDKDMPAYRRMRHKGLQPRGIDGAAALEDKVHDQFDVHYQSLYDKGISRERIREGEDQARQLVSDQ